MLVWLVMHATMQSDMRKVARMASVWTRQVREVRLGDAAVGWPTVLAVVGTLVCAESSTWIPPFRQAPADHRQSAAHQPPLLEFARKRIHTDAGPVAPVRMNEAEGRAAPILLHTFAPLARWRAPFAHSKTLSKVGGHDMT